MVDTDRELKDAIASYHIMMPPNEGKDAARFWIMGARAVGETYPLPAAAEEAGIPR